nr:uncharacterized mitochondrial protein AtMg00810-like [Tanacetum cinerariifolium]
MEARRRVMKSGVWDRVDRSEGSLFGFAGNARQKSFPAAAAVVADRWWWQAVGEEDGVFVKFEAKGDEGYFIGYSMSSNAFRVFNKRTKRVEENLHVDFLENKAIEKGAGRNWLFDIDSLTKSMNYVPVVVVGTNSTNFSGTKDAASQEVKKDVSSLRYIALPNWIHEVHLESSSSQPQDTCNSDKPESSGNSNPTATLTNPSADQLETLKVETPIPTVSSPVPTAYESNGVVADVSNIETTITASPTPILRIHKDHPKSQTIGPVDTPIQTRHKSKEVGELSFIATIHQKTDPSLLQFCLFSCFLSQEKPKKIYDALQDPSWVLKNKKDERGNIIRNKARLVAQAYALFMGFIVYQMDVKSAFLYEEGSLSRQVYRRYPQEIRYSNVRSANTPVDKENPWGKDETGKDVDLHHYRSLIGSLMYLTASRPDIMFVVCACARNQVTPKECHLHAVKRIFRYLKGNPKLGIWYPKESPFDLVAYSDSDYGGATQDRKLTTRRCQFLGRSLISWECKKQTIVATSTTEAEYVAAASCCRQVLWIQNQLLDYGEVPVLSYSEQRTHEFINVCLASASVYVWIGIKTTEEGTKILAIVDSKLRTVSESSIRRNLKLNDEEGIRQFSHQWKYLIHTIMQCLSPKSTGFNQFSSNIATALVCLATNRVYNFSKMIFDDEPASPLGDDSQGEACPIASGIEADQDRANIAKTSTLPSDSTPRSEMVSKFEAQEVEINSLKARIKLLEDKDRGAASQFRDDAPIKRRMLDEGEEAAERVSDDTKEMATVLTSIDAESILTSRGVQVVPTTAEVATTTVSIPTGSGMVSTASPTIPTAALIFTTATESTPYTRRKGKEKMVESDTPKKKKLREQIDVQVARELEEEMDRDAQRMNEQIARYAKIARIHAEDELQMLIDGLDRNNETVAKYLQEYDQFAAELPFERRIELISDLVKYQDNYAKVFKYQTQQRKPLTRKQQKEFYTSVLRNQAGWKAKHFKGMTPEEIKEKFDPVWRQFQDFIPLGSKEEAERFKKKGLRLEQESVTK